MRPHPVGSFRVEGGKALVFSMEVDVIVVCYPLYESIADNDVSTALKPG
jgi:hypothetical protein